MKVLARKPQPKIASRADAADVQSKLILEDDDDSEEEHRKKAAQEYEERKARAIREREEKERRYQEVRAKLFGTDGSSSRPPSATPNESGSRNSSRGKGRGGKQNHSRGSGSNDQSPARPGSQRKQLYDPNYTEKPTSAYVQRRAAGDSSGRSTPIEEKPIRTPRGPDSSGKAGFGFALGAGKGSDAT